MHLWQVEQRDSPVVSYDACWLLEVRSWVVGSAFQHRSAQRAGSLVAAPAGNGEPGGEAAPKQWGPALQEALAEGERPAIIVVDAMALRRAGLVGLLRDWAEASRVSVASSPPDALEAASGSGARFRLAVLNLGGAPVAEPASLSRLKGLIDALPETPVAVVSDSTDAEDVVAALRAGAQAFIPTSTEPAVALQTFTFIMGGGSFFPPAALLERFEGGRPRGGQGTGWMPNGDPRLRPQLLTARQQAVLAHLRDGRSNKVIAKLLGMQESTVKVHMRQIMKRLGVANRTQAALTVAPSPKPPPEASAGAPMAGPGAPMDALAPIRARAAIRGPLLRMHRAPNTLTASG